MKRRILSIITALALCLGMCPPVAMAAGEIDISQNWNNILTEEAGGCQGHTFTGTTAMQARIYVESGAHDVMFSNLNITNGAQVGIAPGVTMNLTIEGTNTISAATHCAGIYVPVGATLVINGTGSLNVSGNGGGAGIGGAAYAPDEDGSDGDPNCGTVEIKGGTVTATGGGVCAGIGGGKTDYVPGNGGTVTINAGTVTATGGSDGYCGGAGIGGSAGVSASDPAGNGGTLTINGGHVTLTPGAYGTDWGAAYGFGQGSGSAPAGTCELTLADASYLTVDSLDPNGKYTINGDPTADMIVVPEDLIYNGKAQELDGKIYIDDSKTGTGTYFNQTFTVKASKDGWNYTISPAEVKEAGNYTVTFSKEGHTSISKTFTVAKSGTDLADGKVKTYNGSEETTSFTASDTITVKAMPTPTGEAPTNSAMFAASFTAPTTGQMAVFVSDTQVSAPVGVGADGTYTMEVSAADVLLAAGGPGTEIPLTARFTANDNMADGQGTATVNITAVAKAEKDNAVIGYYSESNLDDAFAEDSGNAGATITLLSDVEPSTYLTIQINCILNLGGHTITGYIGSTQCVCVDENTAVTILGEGEIISPNGIALAVDGNATLEGGTYTSTGSEDFSHGVNVGENATLSVTGEKVTIRNTGGGYGLNVNFAQSSVRLSAGTYSGGMAAIGSAMPLSNMLAHTNNTRYAFFQNGIPVTKASAWVDGNISDVPLDTPIAWLSDTVTVKACTHAYQYAHTTGATTHSQTCPACGDAKASEKCDFSNGPCPCGAVLAVTLPADLALTYDGTAKTPAVTVTVDGTPLDASNYEVTYADNINAGTNAAKVTVTGKNYTGTATLNFTIGKASLTADGTGTASGTYGAKLSELTVSGLTAKLGATGISGAWKLTGDAVPNVGDSGEYTATFTPTTGAGNYNALTAKVTLNIAKAQFPTPQTGTLSVQNGHTREYTYDLSRLLPVLASGQSFGGEVTYTLKTVNITEAGYYDSDTAAISGTTLTLPVKAVTSSDEGQIGTITVTLSSKNFADVDATINVNRVNKQPVSIEGVTAQNGTYDGESHNGYTGTPTASPYSGGFKTTYVTADGTALSGPPTNAGDYTVTISLEENDTYTGSRTLRFTVAKASITITAANKSAVVGSAQPELTYTVSGLVSGDTLASEPTLTCTPDMNTVGSYPITASGAAVPDTGNYNTEITYVAGTLSVTAKPSTGGGGSVPSNPGSSTITVPVSGDKSTVHVSASVSGTTATVSKIDTSQIENVIGDNGQASMVEIDFTGLGKTIDTVKLPAAAIKDIAAKAQNEEVGGLTVKLPDGEISFDARALSAIQAQAGSQITLTVTPAKPADLNSPQKEAVGSAPVFDLTLRSGSGAITDFRGGYATVSLPYTLAAGQNPSGVVVYYLDSAGNVTPCTTRYDVRSKSAIFTTGHLSLYFVGYDPAAVWENPFSDVAQGAWYYDAVRYASENGLMGGYGNGRFGPNNTLTRAQFAQVLFNKEGRPAVNYLLRYNDVADSAWYTEAVRWATSQGIVGGYGNGMFGPNDNISREQLAVMLWRYAGSPAATKKELAFADTGKISDYAIEALQWAVEQGIVQGKGNGILDPKGKATRAQVAAMLMRSA